MNFHTFILRLNPFEVNNILRLWSEHGINCTNFTINDYEYLQSQYLNSNTVFEFYEYYLSLPVDVQEPRYFEAIITHYKTIYQDYLTNKKYLDTAIY
jgi:hypothetical protein